MAKHIKSEFIEALAEEHAADSNSYVDAFIAYKAGFVKAMELMGRKPRTKIVNGVKYKVRNKVE